VTAQRSSPDVLDGVILLHGISRTALSFRKMQTALEAAGFHLITDADIDKL
jgi:hypothetical protein